MSEQDEAERKGGNERGAGDEVAASGVRMSRAAERSAREAQLARGKHCESSMHEDDQERPLPAAVDWQLEYTSRARHARHDESAAALTRHRAAPDPAHGARANLGFALLQHLLDAY